MGTSPGPNLRSDRGTDSEPDIFKHGSLMETLQICSCECGIGRMWATPGEWTSNTPVMVSSDKHLISLVRFHQFFNGVFGVLVTDDATLCVCPVSQFNFFPCGRAHIYHTHRNKTRITSMVVTTAT